MDPTVQSSSQRPASHSRSFSLRSHGSDDKGNDAPSTHEKADKARRDSFLRGEGSKANPNAAMKESEPGVRAVTEKTTLTSIRDVEHKDANGNIIAEPDLCNPTRPRWERPLDTIRSFERAIDGGYKRRSISRADTYDANNPYASRRSSYYGGRDSGASPSRHSQVGGGYYGGRRPDSYAEYNDGRQGPPRQRYGPRHTSDSAVHRLNGAYGGYPQHGHHQSHDGVTNGSDSTGPWNNSTDPSSENSSPERYASGQRKQQNVETYGYDSYGGGPIQEENATDERGAYPQRMQQGPNGGVPAAPAERKPIKLGGDGALAGQSGTLPPPTVRRPVVEEKKKSWIKRRFSKKE